MQSFGIIHLFDEDGQIRLCISKGFIVFEIDFLLLECFEKRLCLGIVIGIADRRHTDLRSDLLSLLYIVITGVLNSSVGMMDQSRRWTALSNRLLESRQCQLRGHLPRQMPADTAA